MTTEQQAPAAGSGAPTTARMVIGGESVDAADGQTFEVINPATGKVVATAPLGGREDVDRAVAAAQKAFEDRKGWANWAAGKRGRTLSKFAALVKQHTEELAQLETANIGKPITSSRGEITGVSLVLDYYAGAANKIFGQTIPVSKPGLDLTIREPIGVVGLIVPWNFPAYMASWKIAPALAAGNTAILKPASYSPLTAIRLGELALEAGIPRRRPERRHRTRRNGRRVDRGPSRHRQGRVHGRDHDGPGDHAARREQREEDLASSWAARARTSSSPTPTSRSSPASRRTASSTTAARTAAPAAGSSSSDPPTTRSSSCSRRRPGTSRSATRSTRRPRSGRS